MEKPSRAVTLDLTGTPYAHQHSAVLSGPTGEFPKDVLQPAMLAVRAVVKVGITKNQHHDPRVHDGCPARSEGHKRSRKARPPPTQQTRQAECSQNSLEPFFAFRLPHPANFMPGSTSGCMTLNTRLTSVWRPLASAALVRLRMSSSRSIRDCRKRSRDDDRPSTIMK